MKTKPAKRKLSQAALEAMSKGGANGSKAAKRRAGRLGWLTMIHNQAISPSMKPGA